MDSTNPEELKKWFDDLLLKLKENPAHIMTLTPEDQALFMRMSQSVLKRHFG